MHVNDFHATILHLLGFDHEQLTYRYGGRDFRLTDVAGQVIAPILTQPRKLLFLFPEFFDRLQSLLGPWREKKPPRELAGHAG